MERRRELLGQCAHLLKRAEHPLLYSVVQLQLAKCHARLGIDAEEVLASEPSVADVVRRAERAAAASSPERTSNNSSSEDDSSNGSSGGTTLPGGETQIVRADEHPSPRFGSPASIHAGDDGTWYVGGADGDGEVGDRRHGRRSQ